MDGVVSAKQIVDNAKKWGHSAVSLLDFDSVQSFPEFYYSAKAAGIKPIYGVSLSTVNKDTGAIVNSENISIDDQEYVVFDNRVAVDHDLKKGQYDQCHACRMPITAEEMQHEKYEKGVSCPHCFDQQTPEQRQRYAERERQVQLAKARGEEHIGSDVLTAIAKRRQQKKRVREMQKQAQMQKAKR